MDSVLVELRRVLDRLGYVVVPHGDHLCVRLPLAASVRIYSSGGGFRLVSRFGPFGRTSGLVFTTLAAAGAVGATVFTLGLAPVAFFAGFLGITALVHDGCRFVLTESCVTRLQQLLMEIEGGARRLGAADVGRLTASPPGEIRRDDGLKVIAQPGGRVAVPIDRPGEK